MGSLLRKYWFLTLISLLFFASASLAQTATITLTGVGDGANAGGVYVDPYTASITDGKYSSTGTPVICDDWSDETTQNETWQANVNTIASVDAGTNGTTPIFGNNPQLYNKAAWLATQLLALPPTLAYQNQQIAISYALWELTCSTTTGTKGCGGQPFSTLGGSNGDPALLGSSSNMWSLSGGSSSQTAYAYLNYANTYESGYNAQGWEILTPTSGGPPQEFLVDAPVPITAPESSSGVLLSADLLGLLGLVFLFRRRLFRSVQ